MDVKDSTALVVIDVQQGFDDPSFGRRNNPECEANIARLVETWSAAGRPVVRVRHASGQPGAPLAPDSPGHAYKPAVAQITPALEVVKSVHSAFLGTPDLHAWLRQAGVDQVAITGIQTNRCCETTARTACDLGYRVLFVLDATYTFDKEPMTAEQLAEATATNIDGYFGRVVNTADLAS
jgi:nicotinamidase-related amidase